MSTRNVRREYNELFVLCYDLKKLMQEIAALAPQPINAKDGVAYFFFTKIFRTFTTVIRLVKGLQTEEAEMLCRSMYDAYVQMAYILLDETEDTAMRYMEFDDVTRARMYKKVKDKEQFAEYFKKRLENPKPGDEPVAEVEKRAQEWKSKYKSKNDLWWFAPKKLEDLAIAVNMQQFHTTGYDLESQLIHSLPRGMNRYISIKESKIYMDLEHTGAEADMALVASFNMACSAAGKFNEHFNLGKNDELQILVDRLETFVKNNK